jgi:meiosis induction protein kinase IME2/SME1
MALGQEYPPRQSSYGAPLSSVCLEDRFELIKEIGDGSFGSVALARVRTAGAHIARRGTLVCT